MTIIRERPLCIRNVCMYHDEEDYHHARALQLSSDRRWFDMARGLWAAGTSGGGGIVARWWRARNFLFSNYY